MHKQFCMDSYALQKINERKLVFTYSWLANFLTLSFTSLGSLPWCWGQSEGLEVAPSENAERVQRLKQTKNVLKTDRKIFIA